MARRYSKEQKEKFFNELDRGGTVRAAAKTAGVGPEAAYSWLRRAGMSMRRAAPRVYSEEEKAEFFRLLAERGNVSSVARELGFTRVTCYKWAHEAGVFTGKEKRVNARREEFLRLRQAGKTRAEAAAAVGADKRSAADWDKGIRVIAGGRVYPDGRVVRYRPEKILAGVTSQRTTSVHGERVDLERVEQVIHPRYVSLVEREQLRDLRKSGMSIRKIAAVMGRDPSTISRELRRNTISSRGYMPHAAHRASVARRARPKQPKLMGDNELRDYVQARLHEKWSPEQISHRLIKDFPDTPRMRASTETIYQAIYVHARGYLKRELARQLRRGRSIRKPRREANTRTRRFIDPMIRIEHRPGDIDTRASPGHWEGDLIIGGAGKSAIATLVERSSRFVTLGHLGVDRDAETVRDSLIAVAAEFPEALRGTLTWDQGAEMAEHRSFTTATNMDVYFCNPGSPWQRGSNENTNGLLRQYFPKGSDLRPTGSNPYEPSPPNSTTDPANASTGTPPRNDFLLYWTPHSATVATTAGIQAGQGKLYLCAVKDVYSNRIVGYSIGPRMKSSLATSALRNALALRGNPREVIVHSDRGSQFRSKKFRRLLRSHELSGSMGRVGACGDNAAMESFFSLLQKNVLDTRRWETREELRLQIASWIETKYHRRRRQRRLGKLTPIEFETIYTAAHAA